MHARSRWYRLPCVCSACEESYQSGVQWRWIWGNRRWCWCNAVLEMTNENDQAVGRGGASSIRRNMPATHIDGPQDHWLVLLNVGHSRHPIRQEVHAGFQAVTPRSVKVPKLPWLIRGSGRRGADSVWRATDRTTGEGGGGSSWAYSSSYSSS